MSETRTAACAEIVERALPAVAELCRRFGVRRLDLFGSAATGRFDPERSDLDFLVEFGQPRSYGLKGTYFQLLSALEELFRRKVDLVTAGTIENPYLRRQIESEKIALFPRNDR